MNLVFVRHGVTQENTEGRLLGHANPPLSEKGRAQPQRLRERFLREKYQPTHIYTSPLRRAAETANVVASSWLVPIVFCDDLMELDIEIFTGLTWDEIAPKYPELPAGPQEFIDLDNKEREFFVEITAPEVGTHMYPGTVFKLPKIPLVVKKPPVRLGEDNDYIYRDVLCLSEEEYDHLKALGQIGMDYALHVR